MHDRIGKNPMVDDVALAFPYHDCPPERIDWVMSTRIDFYAKRAMEEPCPLVTWPLIPSSYLLCSGDRTINPAWRRKASREWLGVDAIELPCGHCSNVSRPEVLAEALERCSS